MNEKMNQVVVIDNLVYTWQRDTSPVLDIPEFRVRRGERLFLRGPSGSGKTTLLSLVAAVLAPQFGRICVDGVELGTLKGGQRDQFRVDRIGLVFQQFNLLPFLSVIDNITLPCGFSRERRRRACETGSSPAAEASRLLQSMHLPASIADQPVTRLSVGQQQRVAVARALIGRPPLIIADEPTSALDSDNRQAFLDLLFTEVAAAGSTLLFVSHDASLAHSFDRLVDLEQINRVANTSPGFEAAS